MTRWRPRSTLFVPVLVERFIEKAPGCAADALMLDLEDSVAASRKAEARAALPRAVERLAGRTPFLMVRINSEPGHLRADLDAAARAGVSAIMAPKAESAPQIAAVADLLSRAEASAGLAAGSIGIMPLIETPRGVINADEVCRADERVQGVTFGAEDFSRALGVAPAPAAIAQPAQLVVLAAAANGIPAFGLPGSVADFADLEAFERVAELARTLGFTGASAIHPAQVAVLNRTFGISAGELDEARAIVDAYEAAVAAGKGSVGLNGRMVDAPIYERARDLLRRSQVSDAREPADPQASQD